MDIKPRKISDNLMGKLLMPKINLSCLCMSHPNYDSESEGDGNEYFESFRDKCNDDIVILRSVV